MEVQSGTVESDKLNLEKVRDLLWGPSLQDEVFTRWSQGFALSSTEPTALVQYAGGPCAVIAPVQGYLLRNVLFGDHPSLNLHSVSESDTKEYLTDTLLDMLSAVCTGHLTIMTRDTYQHNDLGVACDNGAASSQAKKPREDLESFHSSLRCIHCANTPEDKVKHRPSISTYLNKYGVLLFMYSVILTKGIDEIIQEVQDPGEPLIDSTYGHGSQNLINLFLTGRAVSNVWDNDKELSGLKLRGVNKQSTVGFLSYLEHLRYCEVGWYLKNPSFPIWLLASETHLTVLFSKERGIVYEETKEQTARRVFLSFDTESNGFVQSMVLGDLMAALDLVSEEQYVELMRKRLDCENLGIITLNSFLDEFFPDDPVASSPKCFTVYHYNGLCRSSPNSQLTYQEASVVLEDEPDVQIITDSSPIKLCLQTKWPSIQLKWSNAPATPSIY